MSLLLAALADAPRDRVLFIGEGGAALTAGQVRAAAAAAIRRMHAANEVGEIVFLHTDSAAMFLAGLAAAAAIGRTLAILPQAQPGYLASIGARGAALLADHGDDPALAASPSGADAALPASDNADPRLIFFTSGSTGAPKQALKALSQIEAEAASWRDWLGAGVQDVAGSVSHQHIYGLIFRVVLPVIAGWPSTDRQAFAWESFVEQMGARTLAVTSPAHLGRIPPGLGFRNGAPALALSSGQALPLAAALDAARLFGAPALEILGSTETGGVAMRRRRDDAEPWRPISGVEIGLTHEGALQVRSGWAGEPGDAGAWIALGDRAELLPDGGFRLRGRVDRIAKIEGKRVSLTRVEEALAALPEIEEVALVVLAEARGEVLGAAVKLRADAGPELANLGAFRLSRRLRAQLAQSLEPAERPKRWRFVGRLPQNSQGKRTASDLAALFEPRAITDEISAAKTVTSADEVRLQFAVTAGLPWMEGHFPESPVLAAVAQVHIAVRAGEEVWGYLPASFACSRLKFRRALTPGDVVTLELTRKAERGELAFAYHCEGVVASEGVVGR